MSDKDKGYRVQLKQGAFIHGRLFRAGQVVRWKDEWGKPPRTARVIDERPKKTFVDMGARKKG